MQSIIPQYGGGMDRWRGVDLPVGYLPRTFLLSVCRAEACLQGKVYIYAYIHIYIYIYIYIGVYFSEKMRSWDLYALCVCDALPQALFFSEKMTFLVFVCPVCVWCTAASAFFRKKYVPGFFTPCLCVMHCRRRFFFGKNDVPLFFVTCYSPVEVFLRAAGAFFTENNDSQMALAIVVMAEDWQKPIPWRS